jgi:chromosome segregation ATPase
MMKKKEQKKWKKECLGTMLNFRKRNLKIKELEGEKGLLNEKLNNARSKLNKKEKIIVKKDEEIEELKKTIEGLNLVINNLKTEKSKEFAIKTKNTKNWLHGYHGEGDIGRGDEL